MVNHYLIQHLHLGSELYKLASNYLNVFKMDLGEDLDFYGSLLLPHFYQLLLPLCLAVKFIRSFTTRKYNTDFDLYELIYKRVIVINRRSH